MHDYLKKFLLNELSVFVVGGSGLIGSEICDAVTCAGANTIVLDKIKITNKKIKNSTSLIWRKFDCSNHTILSHAMSSLMKLQPDKQLVSIGV